MKHLPIPIHQLPGNEDLALPAYASEHASGMDLCAALKEPLSLPPLARYAVPTGSCVAIPPGFEGMIRPRSGWALKAGISMVNTPGTIDADYRGEIKVLLINLSEETVTIKRGDRIAQLVVAPVARVEWQLRASLDRTLRGEGGFGHTGI